MRYILLAAVFATLLLIGAAAPPAVISATRTTKSATVFGGEQRYEIFEMEFDQELYYQENWPCPCRNDCTTLIQTAPAVNESGVVSTILERDVGRVFETNFTTVLYFQFSLAASDFPPGHCPIIALELQSIYGQMHLMGSTATARPSLTNHQFYKYQLQRDGMWICPSDTGFAWGRWYLAVQNTPPVTLRNGFRIRWSVVNPTTQLTCPTPSATLPPPPASDGTWTLLRDGQGVEVTLAFLEYRVFRFYSDTECTDFAASARQLERLSEGDVDLYVSLTNDQPALETSYDYAAFINYDDALSLRQVCSPTGTARFPIYMSVQTWKGDNVRAVVVATATMTFLTRPIVDLPPQALFNSLAGSTLQLECGAETLECEFPAHIYCMEPMALYNCCSPLMIIPPTPSANPLWPSLRAFRDLEFSRDLPWALPNGTASWGNVPRKLTLAVLRDVRYPQELRRFFQNATLSGCSLAWRNNFGNAAGEVMTEPVAFSAKILQCNRTAFLAKEQEVAALTQTMENTVDYDALRMFHLQVQMTMLHDDVLGCVDEVARLYTTTDSVLSYDEQPYCYSIRNSADYNADPCCTYQGTFHACCGPRNTTASIMTPDQIIEERIARACRIPECSRRSLGNYMDELETLTTRETTCAPQWRDEYSTRDYTQFLDFIPQCRARFTEQPCAQHSDCQYGVQCDVVRRVCLYPAAAVLECMVDTIDSSVAQSLFNQWQLKQQVTRAVLLAEFTQRFLRPFCTGPDSMRFRDHWHWAAMAPDCVDECARQNLAPRCFETSATFCPIPAECPSESSTACFHWWTFVNGDAIAGQCEDERVTILAGCYVCLTPDNCTRTTFSRTECDAGYCTANASVHDRASCGAQGSCSLACPQCSTRTGCELFGTCSNVTAGCYTPFLTDFYGTPYCDGWTTPTYALGCLTNATQKQACLNGRWITSDSASRAACELNAIAQCYNSGLNFWNNMSDTDCQRCQLSYQPTIGWTQGVWSPGEMRTMQWIENTTTRPVRRIADDVDYFFARSQVLAAIMANVALTYSTEASCRHAPVLSAVHQLACDCVDQDAAAGFCYSTDEASNQRLGVMRSCPFTESNISTASVSLIIPAGAVPVDDFCKVVTISRIPASRFEQTRTGKLSSEVFVDPLRTNFAVVVDATSRVVGQIVTDGIRLEWPSSPAMAQDLTLCIRVQTEIAVDARFNRIGFGRISADSNAIRVVTDTVNNVRGDYICATVREQGVYLGIRYANEPPLYQASTRVMSYVSLALYAAGFVGACFQFARLRRQKRTTSTPVKLGALIATLLFTLARAIYMALPAQTATVANLLLFEVPTLLYYIMYTSVLFLWVKVTKTIIRLKADAATDTNLKRVYYGINAAMATAFLVFIIAYYAVQEPDPLPCRRDEIRPVFVAARSANVAYLIFLATLSIAMAIAYVTLGLLFLKQLFAASVSAGRRKNFIRMTIVVLVSCVSLFVLRSALILWTALSDNVLPLIVFSILEIIPTSILLYYILPPHSLLQTNTPSQAATVATKMTTATTMTMTMTMTMTESQSSKHATSSREKSSPDSAPSSVAEDSVDKQASSSSSSTRSSEPTTKHEENDTRSDSIS